MSQPIPSTMRAVQLDEPKGKLTWREIPVPRPQPGQVLIRLAAAPINPSDIGALSGLSYSGERKYPFTPGMEGSGTVMATGGGVLSRWLNGRRVACAALTSGNGTWAEYMVTAAPLCVPLNRKVSLEQGATLLINPLSALAMFEIAKRGRHRAIVSTAAASALGGMILRLGKRHGIPIIHIVRRQAQADLVRERGGEYVLNSSDENFVEPLRTTARELQATLWLDAIGGEMTQQLATAAPFGSTILLYSRLSSQNSVIDARTALIKNLHFEGWFLGNWMRTNKLFKAWLTSRQAQSLLATDLHSPIHQRFPLSAASQGIETYLNNMTAGKILLVANPQEDRSANFSLRS